MIEMLRCLTMEGYSVRFMRHPINSEFIVILLNDGKYTQRGVVHMSRFNVDVIQHVLKEAQVRLVTFHRVKQGG